MSAALILRTKSDNFEGHRISELRGGEFPWQPVETSQSRDDQTPKEAVSERSGSGRGNGGFRGPLEGWLGAGHPFGSSIGGPK